MDVEVRVVFTIEAEGYPAYTDALYVPLEDYPRLEKSGEIERLKTERWENWRAGYDTPPEPPAPVEPVDALAQARSALTDALAALDAVTPAEEASG